MDDGLQIRRSAKPATPSDLRWEKWAEDLEHSGLLAIRQSAEKWAATIGSLLGVFGVTAVVTGPADLGPTRIVGSVAGVHITQAQLVLGILGLSIVLAIAATATSALAAQGSPREFLLSGVELRRQWRSETAKAAKQLRRARWLAIVAVSALLLAVFVAWATTDNEAASQILAVTRSGEIVCGELEDGKPGFIRVDDGERERDIMLGQLEIIQSTASCP